MTPLAAAYLYVFVVLFSWLATKDRSTSATWAALASAADAAPECSTADTFCDRGVSVANAAGTACTPLFLICDDGDAATNSTCDPERLACSHVMPIATNSTNTDGNGTGTAEDDNATAAVCRQQCVPSCDGRECGEDGCGGFCGQCGSGTGCSNYACVSGLSAGRCDAPLPLGNGAGNNSNVNNSVTMIDTDDARFTLTTEGDTTQAVHAQTPTCNTLTASPELIYAFEVPANRSYGYDFRTTGYDTVLQLMKGMCGSAGTVGGNDENVVACNDDGTPPGDLGSKISGVVGEGVYYVMVDGYSTTDVGPFVLVTTFIRDCEPLCDGSFCGPDGCNGTCGACEDGYECSDVDNRCYVQNCTPACSDRACGEDGCGGSCGSCGEGLFCLGESISPLEDEDGNIVAGLPSSECQAFPVCDHMNPQCSNCTEDQICASDCLCYDSLQDLADLTVLVDSMLDESYLHDLVIPNSSCTLREGCVRAPGLRRLYRFTSTVLNQGHADLAFPEPKERPDLFEFGGCHQHYHFRQFADYRLLSADGETVVMEGQKYAYCMEDTARHFDGTNVNCDKTYDCGFQGISRGWVDQYGWSLDCSWLDITDLPPGDYVLQVEANPARVFPEVSFDNNRASIVVTIPDIAETVSTPLKLVTDRHVAERAPSSPTPAPDSDPVGGAGEASDAHAVRTVAAALVSAVVVAGSYLVG